jgi:hypothetical protein
MRAAGQRSSKPVAEPFPLSTSGAFFRAGHSVPGGQVGFAREKFRVESIKPRAAKTHRWSRKRRVARCRSGQRLEGQTREMRGRKLLAPALEVSAPDRVRAIESAQLRTVTHAWSAPPALRYQPPRTKEASDCAGHWELDSRVIALEDGQQLAWPPPSVRFDTHVPGPNPRKRSCRVRFRLTGFLDHERSIS